MYSAGLNNYLRFAEGEDFSDKKIDFYALDIIVPSTEKTEKRFVSYDRSSIMKKQSLELAGYWCEIDSSHRTFISKNTNKQYIEGHHALPLSIVNAIIKVDQ